MLRTPGPAELVDALRDVVDAARGAGAALVAVHSCAPDVPLDLLRRSGVDAVSLDTALLRRPGWEAVAGLLDAGVRLWAGALPTDGPGTPTAPEHVERLLTSWRELGLPLADLVTLTVTPSCGLAGSTPEAARAMTVTTTQVAARLAEAAVG